MIQLKDARKNYKGENVKQQILKNIRKIFFNKDSKLRSGYKIFIVFVIGIVLILAASLIIQSLFPKYHFLLQGIYEILLMLAPILAWKLKEKKSLKDMGFIRDNKTFKDFTFGLILGAVFISCVSFLLLCSGNSKLSQSLLSPSFTTETVTGLLLCIIIGFGEETLFRGYCIGVILDNNNNKWVAAVISAVLFSLLHVGSPHATILFFINVFLIGLLLAYMVFKTSNIWMPIGFHIMWDYFEGNV